MRCGRGCEIRLCCGCFLSEPQSSCRSRAKVYHHRRRGRKEKVAATYLLLGPRQLAFQLPLLVEQDLVFAAQCGETLGKLVGKLRDVGMCLLSHARVSSVQGMCEKARLAVWVRPAQSARQRQRECVAARRRRTSGCRQGSERARPRRRKGPRVASGHRLS
jgi:hypothetical protein